MCAATPGMSYPASNVFPLCFPFSAVPHSSFCLRYVTLLLRLPTKLLIGSERVSWKSFINAVKDGQVNPMKKDKVMHRKSPLVQGLPSCGQLAASSSASSGAVQRHPHPALRSAGGSAEGCEGGREAGWGAEGGAEAAGAGPHASRRPAQQGPRGGSRLLPGGCRE